MAQFEACLATHTFVEIILSLVLIQVGQLSFIDEILQTLYTYCETCPRFNKSHYMTEKLFKGVLQQQDGYNKGSIITFAL